MGRPRDDRQKDLLLPAHDQIIDMKYPLVRLAGEIDWSFLDGRFGSVCAAGPGQPGLPAAGGGSVHPYSVVLGPSFCKRRSQATALRSVAGG